MSRLLNCGQGQYIKGDRTAHWLYLETRKQFSNGLGIYVLQKKIEVQNIERVDCEHQNKNLSFLALTILVWEYFADFGGIALINEE